jgi:hypothetical protein
MLFRTVQREKNCNVYIRKESLMSFDDLFDEYEENQGDPGGTVHPKDEEENWESSIWNSSAWDKVWGKNDEAVWNSPENPSEKDIDPVGEVGEDPEEIWPDDLNDIFDDFDEF